MERIVIAQPVVTDVTLNPLTESFWLEYGGCGTTEQWWNALQNAYSPDHLTNPLLIIPRMSVFDPDTEQTYTPTWYRVDWYLQGNSGDFTELITSGADFTVRGDWSLLVNKNLTNVQRSLPILCVATYIDPRDSSVIGTVSRQIELVLQEDASNLTPTIGIDGAKIIHFDPLGGVSSQKTLTAKVRLGEADITSTSTIHWYACDAAHTTPVLINATTSAGGVTVPVFPGYVSGQGGSTLVIDMMYSERMLIIAKPVNTDVSPNVDFVTEDYVTLAWDDSNVDAITKTDNGERVDGVQFADKFFDAIINARRNDKTTEALTDAEKQANLLLNWKRRAANGATVVDAGWGLTTIIDGATLRSNQSHQIRCEVYRRGALELVKSGNEAVTCNGEPVYCRG